MKDPHVVSLTYRLKTDATVSFDDPPPLEVDTDSFHVRLDDHELTASMKDHFPSVQSARDVVDPWLRTWEIYTALDHSGQRQIWFDYEDAEIIDLDPPKPGEPDTIQCEPGRLILRGHAATIHVTRKRYPPPPSQFTASQEVAALWNRFKAYRDGKEPLLSMAYFCLSIVERHFNGRRDVAQLLNIERAVLNQAGQLTSTRGDLATARKHGTGQPLTAAEERWLECAVLRIIKQLGAYSGKPPRERLTMGDLP